MADLKHFRKCAKQHCNIMTPHIKSLKDRDTYIIEVTEGTDFDHKAIYGVTVFRMCGNKYENCIKDTYGNDLDKMLTSLNQVEVYLSHVETEIYKLRTHENFVKACKWDNIPENTKFAVFSENNPYAKITVQRGKA